MQGIRKYIKTGYSSIDIQIPEEMKNKEQEIIILPVLDKESTEIDFWSDEELENLSQVDFGTKIKDQEDYSKW